MSVTTLKGTTVDRHGDHSRWTSNGGRRLIGRVFTVLGALVGLTLVSWFRLPEIARGTVWAEDAAVFLRETISIGALQSIPVPYSGYLHVIPRIISGLAFKLAPIDSFSYMMTLLSCVAVAGIAVSVFFLSRSIIRDVPLRLMLAVIPVLLPIGPLEVLGNAANLHWYLLWLSPWLLLYNPNHWYGKALLAVASLATATSEIITGLFIPLALWTFFRSKNYWASSGLILGVGLQLLVTATKPRYDTAGPESSAVEPLSVIYGFVLQAVGSLWETDRRTVADAVLNFGGFALIVPVLIIVGLMTYVMIFGRPKWKWMAAYAFGAAVACWTAAIIVNAQPAFNYASFAAEDWLGRFVFFRYAAAPSMFLLTLLPVACAVAAERTGSRKWRTGLAGPVLLSIFLMMNYFPPTTTRLAGPDWAAGVEAARSACLSDATLVSATVHAAPTDWRIDIPCTVLLRP